MEQIFTSQLRRIGREEGMKGRFDRARSRVGSGRRGWFVVGVFVCAFAIGVPVAWATFGDVPPSNPFYDDINALQGAGITSGCGGGNFCPSDNIFRMAEAAFVHRGMPRAGLGYSSGVSVPSGTAAELGNVTISVPGVPGSTQFVMIVAQVDTQIQSITGCPCLTSYGIWQDSANDYVALGDSMNDALPAAGGTTTEGWNTSSSTMVVAVPTGTTQTFRVLASLTGGTGTVTGYGTIGAMTAPFGASGTNVLGAASAAARVNRAGVRLPAPK
jgi:hypothetical protein